MNIHSLYGLILPYFRKRRFAEFMKVVAPTADDEILDIGGYPDSWLRFPPVGRRIEILNLSSTEFEPTANTGHVIATVAGDGTNLSYPDRSFDVVFSNSVIEHVGDDEAQFRFANEARRVGQQLWIQTPAREFFFEPHFLTPFFHWLPLRMRHRFGRFTIWALLTRPSKDRVAEMVDEIHLLTHSDMERLFPDCTIRREKVLGLFTKSYIATRVERSD